MSRQERAFQRAEITSTDKPVSSAGKTVEVEICQSPAKKTTDVDKKRELIRNDGKETMQGGKSGGTHQKGDLCKKDCDATQTSDQTQVSSSPDDATKEASCLHIIGG